MVYISPEYGKLQCAKCRKTFPMKTMAWYRDEPVECPRCFQKMVFQDGSKFFPFIIKTLVFILGIGLYTYFADECGDYNKFVDYVFFVSILGYAFWFFKSSKFKGGYIELQPATKPNNSSKKDALKRASS